MATVGVKGLTKTRTCFGLFQMLSPDYCSPFDKDFEDCLWCGVEMVWACVMLLLLLWLCSEWTDNFPYDFRDERMSKCLKDMTQLLINIYPELRRDVSILMHNLLSKVWSPVISSDECGCLLYHLISLELGGCVLYLVTVS